MVGSAIVANNERLLNRDVYNAFDPDGDEKAAQEHERGNAPVWGAEGIVFAQPV